MERLIKISEEMINEADNIIQALAFILDTQNTQGYIPAVALLNLKKLKAKLEHALKLTNYIISGLEK